MRSRAIVVSLFLSFVCMIPRVASADTLTITGVGGQNADGVYVYPYYFTESGPSGTQTLVSMSCLNFNRDVTIGESWNVNVIGISSIMPGDTIDGESGLDILADAYLFNQYAAATGNAQLTADIQFAIWSIMDPADALHESAYNANAQALAATALSLAGTLPSSTFAYDSLLVPSGSYPNGGEPQEFIADPHPSVVTVTPEPASLFLLGTGLFSAAILVYRKREKTSISI
jgi:hypothetical protein